MVSFNITCGDLRELCISQNWFTCGTNRQYEKMFSLLNRDVITVKTLHEIAVAIWLCSENVSLERVYHTLREFCFILNKKRNFRNL